MNLPISAAFLIAQTNALANSLASSLAGGTATTAVPAGLPWYREPWGVWALALLAIALPTFVAWFLAKRLRAADMWGTWRPCSWPPPAAASSPGWAGRHGSGSISRAG